MRPPMRGGRGGRDGGRGGGRGGGFGGRGGGFGGRGGGGRGGWQDQGPPESVIEAGCFAHACEGEAVVKLTNEKIPYFNAPIFLENKTQIGKVEEILGPINNVYFTIKMAEGVVATSYKPGDKFYIDPMKLLPLERFLPRPKGAPAAGGRGGEHRAAAVLCVALGVCARHMGRPVHVGGALCSAHGQAMSGVTAQGCCSGRKHQLTRGMRCGVQAGHSCTSFRWPGNTEHLVGQGALLRLVGDSAPPLPTLLKRTPCTDACPC